MLTGKTRWRNAWFGKTPVLQVEHEETFYDNVGPSIECETRKFWRDATPADYLNCPAIALASNSASTKHKGVAMKPIVFFRGDTFYPVDYPVTHSNWHAEADRNPGTTRIEDGITGEVLWLTEAA